MYLKCTSFKKNTSINANFNKTEKDVKNSNIGVLRQIKCIIVSITFLQ
jgi:hypothetical protein